jgi:hypothetical protein
MEGLIFAGFPCLSNGFSMLFKSPFGRRNLHDGHVRMPWMEAVAARVVVFESAHMRGPYKAL